MYATEIDRTNIKYMPITSSTLTEDERSKLLPYIPDQKGVLIQDSIPIFISRIYKDSPENIKLNIMEDVYYRYYVVLNRLSMKRSINTQYIQDIHSYIFEDNYSSSLITENYDDIINNSVNLLTTFNNDKISGKFPNICPINVGADLASNIVLRSNWNEREAIIMMYFIMNFCMFYLGYNLAIPIYEVRDILSVINSNRSPQSDKIIVLRNILGKKIMYGLDYCIEELKKIG